MTFRTVPKVVSKVLGQRTDEPLSGNNFKHFSEADIGFGVGGIEEGFKTRPIYRKTEPRTIEGIISYRSIVSLDKAFFITEEGKRSGILRVSIISV